ncbi:Kelch-like protein 6 [Liparis tanakae]|uniref:Kelch-like protein 6 n=1 Tax=Liparis tanakae TaxID=230148 RepID=A0A4Z2FEY0_9TELE|nr:Kelch-like protein 6 [Liparis tanakae]
MSDSLEKTTDCPLLLLAEDPSGDGEGSSPTESRESPWEDGGLPVELQRGMETLRVNGELTDVVLCVQGHDFPCHRAVLAAASQYFRAMFCRGLKESREARVEIKGLDSGTMHSLLEYTYTSRALLTNSNVQRTLEAASQFQFLRVVDACADFLSKSLQLESCIGILSLADSHALPALRAGARDYIATHFSQVVRQPDFLELPAPSLEAVLQRDDLDARCEECVFEALMLWVRARPEERRPALAGLLAHVRLPLLEAAYLVEQVEADELIRRCSEAFPFLQEARLYHLSGTEVVSERTKPRAQHFLSEVFLIIGGCTKDERFISTVTCLDPLRRSRLEVARLPATEMEDETQNRKWVEFACITFRNEVYISGFDRWIYVIGGGPNGKLATDQVQCWKPGTDSWELRAPIPIETKCTNAVTFKDCIYIVGEL